jgi:hypothetical protein
VSWLDLLVFVIVFFFLLCLLRHIASECSTKSVCWNCKESGHMASNCPNEGICHTCGKTGHRARECSAPSLPPGDLRLCHNCYKQGHIAVECTNEKACNNCRKTGHLARDCPNDPICNVCNVSGDNVQNPTLLETTEAEAASVVLVVVLLLVVVTVMSCAGTASNLVTWVGTAWGPWWFVIIVEVVVTWHMSALQVVLWIATLVGGTNGWQVVGYSYMVVFYGYLVEDWFWILVMYVFALLLFEPGEVTTRSQGWWCQCIGHKLFYRFTLFELVSGVVLLCILLPSKLFNF